MALSPPKASSAGLRARQVAKRDTAASTLIHAIVTVCTRWIRRIVLEEGICSAEAIPHIMALVRHRRSCRGSSGQSGSRGKLTAYSRDRLPKQVSVVDRAKLTRLCRSDADRGRIVVGGTLNQCTQAVNPRVHASHVVCRYSSCGRRRSVGCGPEVALGQRQDRVGNRTGSEALASFPNHTGKLVLRPSPYMR